MDKLEPVALPSVLLEFRNSLWTQLKEELRFLRGIADGSNREREDVFNKMMGRVRQVCQLVDFVPFVSLTTISDVITSVVNFAKDKYCVRNSGNIQGLARTLAGRNEEEVNEFLKTAATEITLRWADPLLSLAGSSRHWVDAQSRLVYVLTYRVMDFLLFSRGPPQQRREPRKKQQAGGRSSSRPVLPSDRPAHILEGSDVSEIEDMMAWVINSESASSERFGRVTVDPELRITGRSFLNEVALYLHSSAGQALVYKRKYSGLGVEPYVAFPRESYERRLRNLFDQNPPDPVSTNPLYGFADRLDAASRGHNKGTLRGKKNKKNKGDAHGDSHPHPVPVVGPTGAIQNGISDPNSASLTPQGAALPAKSIVKPTLVHFFDESHVRSYLAEGHAKFKSAIPSISAGSALPDAGSIEHRELPVFLKGPAVTPGAGPSPAPAAPVPAPAPVTKSAAIRPPLASLLVDPPHGMLPFTEWFKNTHLPADAAGRRFHLAFRGYLNGATLLDSGLAFSIGNFSEVDFSNSTLEHCVFSGAYRISLRNTNLRGVVFRGNIAATDFSLATLDSCIFDDADIRLCNFAWAAIKASSMQRVSFDVGMTGFQLRELDKVTIDSILNNPRLVPPPSSSALSMQTVSETLRGVESYKSEMKRMASSILDIQLQLEELSKKTASLEADLSEHKESTNARFEDQARAITKASRQFQEVKQDAASNNEVVTAKIVDHEHRMQALEKKSKEKDQGQSQFSHQLLFDAVFFQRTARYIRELLLKNPTWSLARTPWVLSSSGLSGVNGPDGSHGTSGAMGGGHGSAGSDGNDGQPGQSARPLHLTIKTIEGVRSHVLVAPSDPTMPLITLPLGDPESCLTIEAKGGNGGHGGKGGNGGKGGDGRAGRDASSSSCGSDGGPGGNGGNGARGARGGLGGDGADVRVMVFEDDLDLCALIAHWDVGKGVGGKLGQFGIGGDGGSGGKGGRSYSGTVYDGGNSRYINNPGGSDGPKGINGLNALNGSSGADGRDGSFNILIFNPNNGNIDAYDNYFRPFIQGCRCIVSTFGVLEPGDFVEFAGVVVQNRGSMPTPTGLYGRGLKIVVTSNPFLEDDPLVPQRVYPSIAFGETYTLDGTVRAQMKEEQICYKDRPHTLLMNVSLSLCVERLNKRLLDSESPPVPVLIGYPVHLSTVYGGHTIKQGDAVPVFAKVKNICRVALGADSISARPVLVHVFADSAVPAGALSLTLDNGKTFDLSEGVLIELDFLPPNREALISGRISMQQPLPLYKSVAIRMVLMLGEKDSVVGAAEDQQAAKSIQTCEHLLQVAEAFHPPPNLDLLLVVTDKTTADEVDQWLRWAEIMEMNVAVWNVAVYCGIDLLDPRFNLLFLLKNKVIVFHNFPFHKDDEHTAGERIFIPTDYLNAYDFFLAAKDFDVRTYVINEFVSPMCNIDVWSFPGGPDVQTHRSRRTFMSSFFGEGARSNSSSELVVIKKWDTSEPPRQELRQRVGKIEKKLSKKRPELMVKVQSEYDPSVQDKGLVFKRYKVGEARLFVGLSMTESRIAERSRVLASSAPTSEVDLFAFMKLLSFPEKLRVLQIEDLPMPYFVMLLQATLAHLADEQRVIVENRGKGIGKSHRKFRRFVQHLDAFCEVRSDVFRENAEKAKEITDSLNHFRILLSFYTDDLKKVKTHCRKMLIGFLQANIPGVRLNELRNSRRLTQSKSTTPTSGTSFLGYLRDPFGMARHGLTFNNWRELRQPEVLKAKLPCHPRDSLFTEPQAVLGHLAAACKFHVRKVDLHPPPVGWTVPEEIETGIKMSFSQVGESAPAATDPSREFGF